MFANWNRGTFAWLGNIGGRTRSRKVRPAFHAEVLECRCLLSTIVTVAGQNSPGYLGEGGPAANALLSSPADVVLDDAGNLFIADTANNVIRRIDPAGIITTVAGIPGVGGNADDEGLAANAQIGSPFDLTFAAAGNLYVTQPSNHVVRRIDPAGIIHAFAGTGDLGYSGDGRRAVSAKLGVPGGALAHPQTNVVLIADTFNARLRGVNTTTGIMNTIAGNGFPFISGDGGPALAAGLGQVQKVAVTNTGDMYLIGSDPSSTLIRKVDADTGIFTTVAGGGNSTADSGAGLDMNLGRVHDIITDGNDLLIGGTGRAWRFDTEDGQYLRNYDHGILLTDIAGDVRLVETTIQENDFDQDGIGNGLHATPVLALDEQTLANHGPVAIHFGNRPE